MKSLILHIGLQKTGSTSIQETLVHNPEVLAKAGFTYAAITWPGEKNSNHSFPMIVAFSEGWEGHEEVVRRGWSPEGLKAHFRGEIDRALETGGNLILSGEDITDVPEDGLRAFGALVREKGFDLRPIMFVRSPLEFVTSMSQTRVRHGHPFHLFKAAKSRKIEMCLRLWPGITSIAFAEALRHPDGPLGAFLQAAGLPAADRFNLIRQNESMSDFATRMIGHVNQVIPLFQDGAVNPLRRYLDTEPLAALAGPRFLLTRAEFAEVRSFIQAENEAYAALLGPGYCDPSFRLQEMPQPWTPEAMQALAVAMADLAPPLKAAARSYFEDPARASPEERELARSLLGAAPPDETGAAQARAKSEKA